jgi:3D (Asp-Asp-Asp) domain-containing protein/uncharacterized protein YabE (DUF348 family)
MGLTLFVTCYAIFASMYVPVMADADTKTIFFADNGVSTPYNTGAETISEFFDERGIALTPRDTLNMEYSDPLESGSKIEIKRGFYINVSIDGTADRYKVSQDTTVGAFIRLYETERHKDYNYTGSLISVLTSEETVFLTEYREETITEETEIPFETQTEEAADLVKGTEKVTQEGQPGKKVSTYKVLFLGEEEHSRELISEDITIAPLPKIVRIGAAAPTPTPKPAASGNLGAKASTADFSYSKVYTMVATAYTAGPESTGKSPGMPGYGITASGMRVRPGVVSVDPRVIPLGTQLYVEGYGYSIAADTGGAIKGNRIDVYMESLSDAYRWGRKTVQVYVLN